LRHGGHVRIGAARRGPDIVRADGRQGVHPCRGRRVLQRDLAGALAYWILSTLTSVVRGTGQATVLAVVYIAAEILHVLLVPTLVFGLDRFRPSGLPVPALRRWSPSPSDAGARLVPRIRAHPVTFSLQSLRLNWRALHEILRVGAPMSLQPLLNNLMLALLTGFVGSLGATALAGFGAAVRLEIRPLSTDLSALAPGCWPWSGRTSVPASPRARRGSPGPAPPSQRV